MTSQICSLKSLFLKPLHFYLFCVIFPHFCISGFQSSVCDHSKNIVKAFSSNRGGAGTLLYHWLRNCQYILLEPLCLTRTIIFTFFKCCQVVLGEDVPILREILLVGGSSSFQLKTLVWNNLLDLPNHNNAFFQNLSNPTLRTIAPLFWFVFFSCQEKQINFCIFKRTVLQSHVNRDGSCSSSLFPFCWLRVVNEVVIANCSWWARTCDPPNPWGVWCEQTRRMAR